MGAAALLLLFGESVASPVTGYGRIEFTLPKSQLAYTIANSRTEFTMPENRLEYTGREP